MIDALSERNVRIKLIDTTYENIDEFMSQGEGEKPWEVFELTQAQDVRKWCDNPDMIEGIKENLQDLANHIPDAGKVSVLDVGCYGGYLYDYLSKKLNEISYTGIDVNEDVISTTKKIHAGKDNANFIVGDILNLPDELKPNSFNVVCCHRVTIHLPYFEQILLNLLYLTKDIVHVILLLGVNDFCEKILETNLVTGKGVFYYRRYISRNTIAKILKQWPVNYHIQTNSESRYASLFIYK